MKMKMFNLDETLDLIKTKEPKVTRLELNEVQISANDFALICDELKKNVFITELICMGTELVSLEPLAELTHLKKLDLGTNDIEDIKPLKDLISLEKLILQCNKITDITPLAGLIQLTILDLSGNDIESPEILKVFTQLQTLSMGETKLDNIEFLSGLTSLQVLDLDHNAFNDISPLVFLRQLRLLNLTDIDIQDTQPLGKLPNLEELTMNPEKLSLLPLANLTKLKNFTPISSKRMIPEQTSLLALIIERNLTMRNKSIQNKCIIYNNYAANLGLQEKSFPSLLNLCTNRLTFFKTQQIHYKQSTISIPKELEEIIKSWEFDEITHIANSDPECVLNLT